MPQTVTGNYTFVGAGNVSLRTIILTLRTWFPLGVNWSVAVVSGGPVARGISTMAAVTDGRQYNPDDGYTAQQFDDSTQIYFRPTNIGDVISVLVSSRT